VQVQQLVYFNGLSINSLFSFLSKSLKKVLFLEVKKAQK